MADNKTGRRNIDGDYVVISYDAASHATVWYNYHHVRDPKNRDESPYSITRNGSFLPVVYSREKLAVHVCNLHFGDQLIVTTDPLAVPEGGADIRGTIPPTNSGISAALDALQTAAATGGPAGESGLGFASTPATLGTTTVSGVAAGTISRGSDGKANYASPTITASGEQIARMMYQVIRSGEEIGYNTRNLRRGHPPRNGNIPSEILSGSIEDILAQAMVWKQKVDKDRADISASAAFDEDLSGAQAVAAQLTNLAASLSAQAIGAKALSVQANFATLRGIIDLAEKARENCTREPSRDLPAAGTSDRLNPIPSADVRCSQFDETAFLEFLDTYHRTLVRLAEQDPYGRDAVLGWTPAVLFTDITDLRTQLENLDLVSGQLFHELNSWESCSRVEQTDLITPATNNTLMRISIIVQRGYTPFTLTTNTAPAAPTLPAAPPSTTTTGTPAHAVKTVLVEVHRLANFNLAGGVMVIHVPTSTFSLTPAIDASVTGTTTVTTGTSTTSSGTTTTTSTSNNYGGSCGGSTAVNPTPANASTYSCILTTQQTHWQVAGMAGISWYPWGRDYFPRRNGYSNYARNYIPAFLVATSVTSFGSGFGGLNFEPLSGIDFFVGIASANRSVLPNGITLTTMVPTNYTIVPGTQVHTGIAAGLAFDLGVISTLFSKSTPSSGLP